MGLLTRLKHATGFTTPNDLSTNLSNAVPFTLSAAQALRIAHRNPVVCACINWITDQASTAPLQMREANDEGEFEIVAEHDLLTLLRKPSEFMSGKELLSVSVWDMLVLGQCFWHKDRLRNGQIDTLTFLPASRVTVKGSAERLITHYEYRPDNGPPIDYQPEDIVHIRIEPNPQDPKNGLSPLECVAHELLIDGQAAEYSSNELSGEGAAGGFLMPPKENPVLTEGVAKKTRDYVQKEFAGTKRGTLGVLRARMEYIRTGLSPQSMTLRSMQNTSEERICGVLGVHPVILGLGSGATQSRVGAATKELERAAWTNRIIPMQDTISEQIGRQLLPDFVEEDQLDIWQMGHDRSNVLSLQPDMLQEAQRWSINVRAGIATRYDARRAQDLEATDADKVYLLPPTLVPSDGSIPPPVAEEPPSQDPEERSLVTQALLITSTTKAELNDLQRSLIVSLAGDAQRLEEPFIQDLEDAFQNLGERAVEAFWTVDNGSGIFASREADVATKQDGAEAISSATDDTRRIMQAITIEAWEQQVLAPAWDGSTLRVMEATVGTVNSTLNLGVNLPDPVAQHVIQQGGIRRGLVDVTTQTREAIFRALYEGRVNGEGVLDLALRIREQVPAGPFPNAGPRYRSQLIARTETKYSQNLSTLETYKAADTVTGLIVIDAQLGDTDEPCLAVDGRTVTFQEAETIGMLQHPGCTRSFAPIVRSR